MPLKVSSESPSELEATLKASATTSKPAFAVIYASLVNSKSWCGDCRDAEAFVNSKFASGEDVVKVVYAGQRDEWRKQDNPWRAAPFKITNLPTLVKVTADGKVEKLVEADVYNQRKLDAFVGF
ncbi:hypothetical protein BKA64DRAFT_659646 [Cadophora sp. MPI-SDFR-AT-0126]|nr:hypothetical protein BKA64DRAFT_659646 [Leotiomycetes sp. MPI-SDFR-AT-0126]